MQQPLVRSSFHYFLWDTAAVNQETSLSIATKGLENERTIILQLEPLEAILVAVEGLMLANLGL
jgi:hypothetical protein